MRVNLYSQELTNEVGTVTEESGTGRTYTGIRFFLHSSLHLHRTPSDDDRSAVTFWLPDSPERREDIAETFERAAKFIRMGHHAGAEAIAAAINTELPTPEAVAELYRSEFPAGPLAGSVQVFPDPPEVGQKAAIIATVRDALVPFGVHLSIEGVATLLSNLTPGETRAAGQWADKLLDERYKDLPVEEVPIYLRKQL